MMIVGKCPWWERQLHLGVLDGGAVSVETESGKHASGVTLPLMQSGRCSQLYSSLIKHHRKQTASGPESAYIEEDYSEPHYASADLEDWLDTECRITGLLNNLVQDGGPVLTMVDLILNGSTVRAAAEQVGLSETAARKRLRKLGRFSQF